MYLYISDDSDVFVLLLHHYAKQKLTGVVIMESPDLLMIVTIDIKATAIEYRNIIPDFLAAHALSVCDTAACYIGIGKGTIVKTLKHRILRFPH